MVPVLMVRNTASIAKSQTPGHRSTAVTGQEIRNAKIRPKKRSSTAGPLPPQEPSKTFPFSMSQAEQMDRIAELENELQSLWSHYASSRRQKLDLMEEKCNLQSEICRLKKSVAHEKRLRGIAEAQLDTDQCEPYL